MQNKQIYIDFILNCFGKGIVERGEVMATFGKEWQTPARTFDRYYKTAKEQYKQYQETINKARLEESIKLEKEAVKNGLKTKNERLLILQNLVDVCLEELTTKQCNDTVVQDGKAKNIKRLMNQRELNDTRKTLKDLQQEISKIEGDYAPTKTENSIITNKEIAEEVKETIADIINKHLE